MIHHQRCLCILTDALVIRPLQGFHAGCVTGCYLPPQVYELLADVQHGAGKTWCKKQITDYWLKKKKKKKSAQKSCLFVWGVCKVTYFIIVIMFEAKKEVCNSCIVCSLRIPFLAAALEVQESFHAHLDVTCIDLMSAGQVILFFLPGVATWNNVGMKLQISVKAHFMQILSVNYEWCLIDNTFDKNHTCYLCSLWTGGHL